jgi:O-antigen ligase
MLSQLIKPLYPFHTVYSRALRNSLGLAAWLGILSILTAAIAITLSSGQPGPAVIAWVLFLFGAAAILYRPRFGLYQILFYSLLADTGLMFWFPFTKNFSSRESLMFVSDAIIFSPLEVFIVLTFAAWMIHRVALNRLRFFYGQLFIPAVAFFFFSVLGLAYGLYTSGNLTIALWEFRPIAYLAALIILSSNLLEYREHAIRLFWVAMAALIVEGIIGTLVLFVTLKGSLAGVASLTQHAVAIHINSALIFAMALWIYRTPPRQRMVMLAALPVLLITYFATQRRAGFLSLGIALLALSVILLVQNYRLFLRIVPPMILLGTLYLAVFWNQQGILAHPAEAVKSIMAPEQASFASQSSNFYRWLENANISYTIHQNPLTGVGFGQTFLVIYPMADISFFDWWQYLAHNSILWIWLKTGLFGFLAMLFLVGSALAISAQVLMRLPRDEISAVMAAASLYLLMHFIYAYADISWDTRSMVYVGSVIGMVNCMPRIVGKRLPLTPKRWPWQPDPEPETLPVGEEVRQK